MEEVMEIEQEIASLAGSIETYQKTLQAIGDETRQLCPINYRFSKIICLRQ